MLRATPQASSQSSINSVSDIDSPPRESAFGRICTSFATLVKGFSLYRPTSQRRRYAKKSPAAPAGIHNHPGEVGKTCEDSVQREETRREEACTVETPLTILQLVRYWKREKVQVRRNSLSSLDTSAQKDASSPSSSTTSSTGGSGSPSDFFAPTSTSSDAAASSYSLDSDTSGSSADASFDAQATPTPVPRSLACKSGDDEVDRVVPLSLPAAPVHDAKGKAVDPSEHPINLPKAASPPRSLITLFKPPAKPAASATTPSTPATVATINGPRDVRDSTGRFFNPSPIAKAGAPADWVGNALKHSKAYNPETASSPSSPALTPLPIKRLFEFPPPVPLPSFRFSRASSPPKAAPSPEISGSAEGINDTVESTNSTPEVSVTTPEGSSRSAQVSPLDMLMLQVQHSELTSMPDIAAFHERLANGQTSSGTPYAFSYGSGLDLKTSPFESDTSSTHGHSCTPSTSQLETPCKTMRDFAREIERASISVQTDAQVTASGHPLSSSALQLEIPTKTSRGLAHKAEKVSIGVQTEAQVRPKTTVTKGTQTENPRTRRSAAASTSASSSRSTSRSSTSSSTSTEAETDITDSTTPASSSPATSRSSSPYESRPRPSSTTPQGSPTSTTQVARVPSTPATESPSSTTPVGSTLIRSAHIAVAQSACAAHSTTPAGAPPPKPIRVSKAPSTRSADTVVPATTTTPAGSPPKTRRAVAPVAAPKEVKTPMAAEISIAQVTEASTTPMPASSRRILDESKAAFMKASRDCEELVAKYWPVRSEHYLV